jgi:pimeloyl-ACP methyl ester carboxylesterase
MNPMKNSLKQACAAMVAAISVLAGSYVLAEEKGERHQPVKEVANSTITIGSLGTLRLYVSRDWSTPSPGITRAIVMVHGVGRDAYGYFRGAEMARATAGQTGQASIVIAPHFLDEVDVKAFDLPPDTLRWSGGKWEDGEPAKGPSSASSFEVLDAIVERLADRQFFPDLRLVVIAGHSGGGQLLHRYAIFGRAEATLRRQGINVRYVVANPSSYAYFDAQRPEPSIVASCPGYDKWKYGMDARPPYVAGGTPREAEHRYVSRQVIYLIGTLDTDPNHPELDKTCMAEAEGPTRYARGHTYFQTMAARDNGTPNHRLWDVPGVGHDGPKMFNSPCGLAALFDLEGCAAAR